MSTSKMTIGARGWFIALVLMLFSILALVPSKAWADVPVPNGSGEDSAELQAAIDAANGTAANPTVITMDPAPCSNPYTLDPGTSGFGLTFGAGDAHIVFQPSDPTKDFCMSRTSGVGKDTGHYMRWFRVNDGNADNITFRHMQIDGNSNDDGFLLDGANTSGPGTGNKYDSIFNLNPADATPGNTSTYITGFTLEDVTLTDVFGVCWFSQHTTDIDINNFRCLDPTKDGLTFGFGSKGVEFTNSSATLTGDDALAFNSCWEGNANAGESECALAGDAYVNNFTGGVDSRTYNGAAFFCRGCHDVLVENSTFNRSAVGRGNNTNKGSVMIEESGDSDPAFLHASNVTIRSGSVNAGAIHHGFRVDDPSPSNIGMNGNVINYASPYCGIKITPRTPRGPLTWGGNNFNPNTAKNVC